jgi:hypothetical protein
LNIRAAVTGIAIVVIAGLVASPAVAAPKPIVHASIPIVKGLACNAAVTGDVTNHNKVSKTTYALCKVNNPWKTPTTTTPMEVRFAIGGSLTLYTVIVGQVPTVVQGSD